ncbi:MAG TPA: hypothetical protein VK178_06960 [Opitutaceae bacterium]|nr:hypothetical protein [Opitutaceae bacterium]
MPVPTPIVDSWALRLPRANASALIGLRLTAGIELGEDGASLWLRGQRADDTLRAALRALPAVARFDWLPDNRLRPAGAWLGAERMPELRWIPLREWLRPVFPSSRPPADAPPPVLLELVPTTRERPANARLLALDGWLDWARTAPLLRLERLRFAASPDGRCLVLGAPPPPLPGRACVECAGVVTPAGLTWQPSAPVELIRRVAGAPERAILWWDETGARVLDADLFVPASRAAIAATAAARRAGGPAA